MNTENLLNLSSSQRILLAEKLWDSVSEKEVQISDDLRKELDHRLNQLENDAVEFYTWEEVKTMLKKHK